MIKVEPIYTGGNIYVFMGEVERGTYFMAESCEFGVMLLDSDPLKAGDEAYFYEWQKEHCLKELEERAALRFFINILSWVKANKPKGNYIMPDIEILHDECSSRLLAKVLGCED